MLPNEFMAVSSGGVMEFWKGFADGYRGDAKTTNSGIPAQLVKLALMCLLGSALLAARHGEAVSQSDTGFWNGAVLGYFLAVFSVLLMTGALGYGITWLVRPMRAIAPHVGGFLVIVLFLGLRFQS
jgi:hypothetical protein